MFWAFLTWPKFSITSYAMISALARQGMSPKVVIDVGANVGQFAVASEKLFPEASVHSFEPNPNCYTALRKNVSSLSGIATYSVALGAQEGESTFHLNAHSHSSSMLPLADNHTEAFPEARETSAVQVRVSTLDLIFDGMELPSPVLLKLDVQGYEAQVLRGGAETLKRVDYVVLEASFKPMYQGEMLFMDLVRLMESAGFFFSRPVGLLSHPKTGEILQMDALFERAERSR